MGSVLRSLPWPHQYMHYPHCDILHRPHMYHDPKHSQRVCSVHLALLSSRFSSSFFPSPPDGWTALGLFWKKDWKRVQRNSSRGTATQVSHTILEGSGEQNGRQAQCKGAWIYNTSNCLTTTQATRRKDKRKA